MPETWMESGAWSFEIATGGEIFHHQALGDWVLVGSADDNDWVVPGLPPYAFRLRLTEAGCEVKVMHPLPSEDVLRFEPGNPLQLGQVRFSLSKAAPEARGLGRSRAEAVLEALTAIQRRLGEEKSLQSVLNETLNVLLDLLKGRDGFVFTLNAAGQPEAMAQKVTDASRSLDRLYSDTVVQEVLRSRQPLLVRNAIEDQAYSQSESVLSLKLSSVLCAPVTIADRLIGVFYVAAAGSRPVFGQAELDMLTLFATLVGSLIHHAAYIRQQNVLLGAALRESSQHGLIAQSPRMRHLVDEAAAVADSNLNLLILGETGTGKDRLAHWIHKQSPRRDKPFLVLNCSTLRGEMLAGELFGYRKGAFTGAVRDYRGLFLSAHGGTLFLDEVGELEIGLQASLLRVLETRKVRPLGQAHEEDADVRILAATHRNLFKDVAEGRFREDLFYRLQQHVMTLPPLRERGEDILLIAYHLLEKAKAEHSTRPILDFHPETLEAMRLYRWPGNIREMQNAIGRAVVLSREPFVKLDFPQADSASFVTLEEATLQFQTGYIAKVMSLCAGDKDKAAALLGIGRSTLFRRLAEQAEGDEARKSAGQGRF